MHGDPLGAMEHGEMARYSRFALAMSSPAMDALATSWCFTDFLCDPKFRTLVDGGNAYFIIGIGVE